MYAYTIYVSLWPAWKRGSVAIISLRLGFRRNLLSVLHPNLVSSPIKGILEILNLTPRCIPKSKIYFKLTAILLNSRTSSSSFNKCIPLSRVLSHWKLYTCGHVSNLPFTIKIKTFQKCTIKNKEVEIMEGWWMSGYDGRCQWSLSWLGSVVGCSRVWWC
jgi:hypothetical protein